MTFQDDAVADQWNGQWTETKSVGANAAEHSKESRRGCFIQSCGSKDLTGRRGCSHNRPLVREVTGTIVNNQFHATEPLHLHGSSTGVVRPIILEYLPV